MLINHRNSADRLKVQRMLFSLWMALAAIMVILTMAAGLATSSHASDAVDPMTTSAIASAPISKASDRIFVTGLLALGFGTLGVGGVLLTLGSIRESRVRRNRE
ncbi:Mn2+/Fe2+ NRAMP family transporter [Agrobacterium larrymoorei]|uniref:Mn2+/Fe2+ NRAMP family transporter n=1 Tax=Agrobacterium larrymoorei TaxID=160699 RepID=A0AAJ2BHH7_9HYPH|nr:hypothetical protein [Agrobacterium larrymoorei]MDR6102859.1 Mn2+/Fe2+ NRAMP family transporter [Agrobacterium larrymoorei]